jgi:cell division protein FtsX
VGFSSSLSSILVPQAFMDWSNAYFAPKDEANHTRLLMQVTNATDKNVSQYLEDHGMEIEQDQMNQEKIAYFLRIVVSLVLIIGLVISALSFYILMLSIYLLVQKNAQKLENLLLIGYSPSRVARPYQMLTAILNLIVLVIAIVAVMIVRSYYMTMIEDIYPELAKGSILSMLTVGASLFLLVTLVNILVIRRKIIRIWYRKD